MNELERSGSAFHAWRTVVFWALLTAASGAAAQAQEIVYAVVVSNEVWPKGPRADGKLTALSFAFGAQVDVMAGGKPPAMQDQVLTIPVGEPVALWLRNAMIGKVMNSVLIEFPIASQRAQPRAPFAVRFTNVAVTSVQIVKQSNVAGPGVAEVKFKAVGLEVFTATQDATGAMKPGPQFSWDFARQRPLQ